MNYTLSLINFYQTNMTPEERIILSQIGRQGGQAKSEKKTKANRENAINGWKKRKARLLGGKKGVWHNTHQNVHHWKAIYYQLEILYIQSVTATATTPLTSCTTIE